MSILTSLFVNRFSCLAAGEVNLGVFLVFIATRHYKRTFVSEKFIFFVAASLLRPEHPAIGSFLCKRRLRLPKAPLLPGPLSSYKTLVLFSLLPFFQFSIFQNKRLHTSHFCFITFQFNKWSINQLARIKKNFTKR